MTSRNICLTNEFPNGDYYKVHCDCGSDEHNQTMEIEVNDGTIYLRFYQKVFSKHMWCPIEWSETVKDWKMRFSTAWTILTKGYVEYESEFLFQNENAIEDYMKAIKQSLEKMKAQRAEDAKKYNGEVDKPNIPFPPVKIFKEIFGVLTETEESKEATRKWQKEMNEIVNNYVQT